MSVTGLCQVCEEAQAEHTCPTCGTAVCQAHYDPVSGRCESCAIGDGELSE